MQVKFNKFSKYLNIKKVGKSKNKIKIVVFSKFFN